jgi:CDGSH iron-sulfur domain-containing protein 3
MEEKIKKNKSPQKTNLEIGKDYYWCACGLSKDGIFCDGSHKSTNLQPMKFTVQESKPYFLCSCKKTNNKPFCDGAHSKA